MRRDVGARWSPSPDASTPSAADRTRRTCRWRAPSWSRCRAPRRSCAGSTTCALTRATRRRPIARPPRRCGARARATSARCGSRAPPTWCARRRSTPTDASRCPTCPPGAGWCGRRIPSSWTRARRGTRPAIASGIGYRPGWSATTRSRRPTRNTALLLCRLFLRLRRLLRSGRGADGHRRHLPAFIHVADADLVTRREVLGGDVLAGLPDLRLVADGEGPLRLLALRLARHHDAVGAGRLDRAHRRVMRGLLLHLLHLLLFRLRGRRRRLGAGEPGAGEHERDPYECSKRSLHGYSSWVVGCRWNLGLGPVGALPP